MKQIDLKDSIAAKNAFSNAILILCVLLLSCNRDEVFEKEQYKNVFGLISESDNVIRKFHQLGEESTGYVAASLGGTNPTTKDITVSLVEDLSLIDRYNLTNFDVDRSKYIQPLAKDKYDIESFQFTIPAGKISGRLPIRIRPDGLSPDSAYFIALRVETFTSYELNPEKSYVFYRVKTKNWWAISDGSTIYNMRAKFKVKNSEAEINLPGTKVMHPISKRKVRIVAGNEKYESNVKLLNKSAIILDISEEGKIKISPYKDIEVTQIDGNPEFPNIFKIENDGFFTYKTFLLCYEYKGSDGVIYQIKEELRMAYDEKNEDQS